MDYASFAMEIMQKKKTNSQVGGCRGFINGKYLKMYGLVFFNGATKSLEFGVQKELRQVLGAVLLSVGCEEYPGLTTLKVFEFWFSD